MKRIIEDEEGREYQKKEYSNWLASSKFIYWKFLGKQGLGKDCGKWEGRVQIISMAIAKLIL